MSLPNKRLSASKDTLWLHRNRQHYGKRDPKLWLPTVNARSERCLGESSRLEDWMKGDFFTKQPSPIGRESNPQLPVNNAPLSSSPAGSKRPRPQRPKPRQREDSFLKMASEEDQRVVQRILEVLRSHNGNFRRLTRLSWTESDHGHHHYSHVDGAGTTNNLNNNDDNNGNDQEHSHSNRNVNYNEHDSYVIAPEDGAAIEVGDNDDDDDHAITDTNGCMYSNTKDTATKDRCSFIISSVKSNTNANTTTNSTSTGEETSFYNNNYARSNLPNSKQHSRKSVREGVSSTTAFSLHRTTTTTSRKSVAFRSTNEVLCVDYEMTDYGLHIAGLC